MKKPDVETPGEILAESEHTRSANSGEISIIEMRQIRRAATEFEVAMRQLGQALDTAKTLKAELHDLELEIRRFGSLVIQTSATPNKRLPIPENGADPSN